MKITRVNTFETESAFKLYKKTTRESSYLHVANQSTRNTELDDTLDKTRNELDNQSQQIKNDF